MEFNEFKKFRGLTHTQPRIVRPNLDKEYFQICNKVFPSIAMFRFELDMNVAEVALTHVSSSWTDITNVSEADTLDNLYNVLPKVHVDDMQRLITAMYESCIHVADFSIDIRYFYTEDNIRDIYIASRPQKFDNLLISDGFLIDTTNCRKHPHPDRCSLLLDHISKLHGEMLGCP